MRPRRVATTSSLSGVSYFNKGQAVSVTVTANDGTTRTALTSSSVTGSNTAPTAPVVEITPADAESGEDLTCSVTTDSTDVDGDELTYVFAWDVGGEELTSATDGPTSSVVYDAAAGPWTCEVDAGDGTGVSGLGVDSVTVTAACNTVTANIGVGSSPYGVAVNPAGTRACVTNDGGNSVSVIDDLCGG